MTTTNNKITKAPRQFNPETDREYLRCDHCNVYIEDYHPYHYTIGDDPHVHLCEACHVKQLQPKWIRIRDGKPKESGCYIVVKLLYYDFTPVVDKIYFDANTGRWEDDEHGVEFWMELPEPPVCEHWGYRHKKYPENKPEQSGYIWVCEYTEKCEKTDYVWYDADNDKFLTDKLNVEWFLVKRG